MRIAIVSPGMLPVLGKSRSSVEIAIDEIARRLAGRHSVHVYGCSRRGGTQTLPGGGVLHNYRGHDYTGWLVQKLRADHPDAVQVENRPLIAARLRRALPRSLPVVLGLHSLTYIRPARYGAKQIRAALAATHGVIVNSNGLARYVRYKYPRACRRLWRVHLGVNLGAFRPARDKAGSAMRRGLRAKLALPQDAKVILFVGRLIRQKGVHQLIAALPRVRRALGDVRLVIVGGARAGGWQRTHYVGQLKRQARAAGGTVLLAGYVPHQILPAYYAAADAVVTPSIGHEALCLVNLEAMASGLPVVSTRIGGIPEVVAHGETGLLVSPLRLRRELAPAIIATLGSASEFGANGRRRVETHFTWERTAVQYEQIYTSLLRGGRADSDQTRNTIAQPADAGARREPAEGHAGSALSGGSDDSRCKDQGSLRRDRPDGRGLLR